MRRAVPLVLLAFWAVWLTVVATTNVTNGLRTVGALPETFPFASSNYQLIANATAIYRLPEVAVVVLFVGVIAWQLGAAGLFWRAAVAWGRGGTKGIDAAFAASLALFGAFMVADEVLIAYAIQATHMRIFAAQALSYLVVRSAVRDEARRA